MVACLAASIIFIGCGKDKNDDAKSQKEAVLAALDKKANLSEFAEALKALDFANVKSGALTIFAVQNGGMSKSLVKATGDEFDVRRHIVEGKHELTDGAELTALDGTTLMVQVVGGKIYINGEELLGAEIQADKSVVYVVATALSVAVSGGRQKDPEKVTGSSSNLANCKEVVARFVLAGGSAIDVIRAPVVDGKFSLTLPVPPDEKFLWEKIEEFFELQGSANWEGYQEIKCSNNAKITHVFLQSWTFTSTYGTTYMPSVKYDDGTSCRLYGYLYVSNDVSVTGTGKYGSRTYIYKMHLKAGWNPILEWFDGNYTRERFTGKLPDGLQ